VKVGFDIDDVLYGWSAKAHQLCVDAGITNGRPLHTWRMWESYGCTQEEWAEVMRAGTETGELYLDPPFELGQQALAVARELGWEIHLVTARACAGWPSTELVRYLTEHWLDYWSIPHDSLTFSKDKPAVCAEKGITHFIDDGVHNYEALDAAGVEVWLMDAPHNREFLAERVVYSPLMFVNKIAAAQPIAM
jgi:hypothetical protein